MQFGIKKYLNLQWTLAVLFVFALFFLADIIPNNPVDPWALISPQKIIHMLGALALIHLMGATLVHILGARAGVIISGFLAGIVSSTALTASLARDSQHLSQEELRVRAMAFLSATLAMLLQALTLVSVGLESVPVKIVILYSGPIIMTTVLLFIRTQKSKNIKIHINTVKPLDYIALIKLTIFILGVITLSKILQMSFGQSGLEVLTFLISLFEMHGAVIANVQLYVGSAIQLDFLITLLSLSIIASYASKVGLIYFLGNRFLKNRVMIWSSLVLLSLFASWIFIYQFTS